ncbi:unnamed protein product [Blepharisma stoltei]|uniref:Uncharacterized protein n=1 Tax=Blepharisma stoltei TaxID=1481888 RepID=A0AAU9IJC9_9CILI|nr:unnamed protein product [Blepharisma stoltei]
MAESHFSKITAHLSLLKSAQMKRRARLPSSDSNLKLQLSLKAIPNKTYTNLDLLEEGKNLKRSVPRSRKSFSQSAQKIWLSKPKSGLEVQRIRERNLIQKYSKSADISPRSVIQSGVFSFKTLSVLLEHCRLNINVPDTLIFGYGFESPSLIYTDFDGSLKIKTSLVASQIYTIIRIFEAHRKSNLISPLAIMKTPDSHYDRIFMKANEIKYELKDAYKHEAVIQRYILPKGRKAFKIRIMWSLKELKIFTITNKDRLDGKKEYNALDSVYYVCSPKEAYKRYGREGIPLTNHTKIVQKKYEDTKEPSNSEKIEIQVIRTPEKSSRHSPVLIKKSLQDSYLMPLDKFFAKEKGLMGKLVEMGSFDDTFRSATYSEDLNKKSPLRLARSVSKNETDYSGMDTENMSNSSFAVLRKQKTQHQIAEDFEEYLSSSKSYPGLSLKALYHELNYGKQFDAYKNEEILVDERALSNYYINKLRNMYCTESDIPEKTIIYEIKMNQSYADAVRQLHEIREHINKVILAKENLKLSELVLDFSEDRDKKFYFLKIFTYKCTQLQNESASFVYSKNPKFFCPGEYCGIRKKFSRTSENSTKVASIVEKQEKGKMILRKSLLIDKLKDTNNITELLNPRLYEGVMVCNNCYKAYTEKEKLDYEKNLKEAMEARNKRMLDNKIEKLLDEEKPLEKLKEMKRTNKYCEFNNSISYYKKNSPNSSLNTGHRKQSSMFANMREMYFRAKKEEIEDIINNDFEVY